MFPKSASETSSDAIEFFNIFKRLPLITSCLHFGYWDEKKDPIKIAHPESDKIGIFKDRQRLPKRVRSSKKKDDLDY